MSTPDITHLDATALVELQRDGIVTAAQIAEHYLDRIAARGPELNAVVHTDAEGALAAAAALDARRAAGGEFGLLAGVPITVKDAFAVAGMPASEGRFETLSTPSFDAPVVANVRRQDAVLLGKTNVPPFLGDHQSDNPVYGRTVNPWDAERTPGGSSGGSAAAVSAGLSAADVGSDLAGSVRVPASWTGLFGHFPSYGLVSKQGHLPRPLTSRLEPSLSTTGPLTRSARDLRLMLLAMIGAAPPASAVWTAALPECRIDSVAGTRIGLWFDDETAPIDAETQTVVEQLATRLEDAGCVLTPFRPPLAGSTMAGLFDRLRDGEIVHGFTGAEWEAAADAERALPDDAKLLSQSRRQSWVDGEIQADLSAAWDAQFDAIDLVLSPSVPFAAPRHSDIPAADRRTTLRGREFATSDLVSGWSKLTNVVRAPCTIVPAGIGATSGLPIGAQFIGPRFGDLTTIGFAALLERSALIHRPTPPGW
jgi:amidase